MSRHDVRLVLRVLRRHSDDARTQVVRKMEINDKKTNDNVHILQSVVICIKPDCIPYLLFAHVHEVDC